ncbi:MAG: type IV secretory system conjugative DNA transfer family protein [Clostridiales bacterium]|nr:type IV secretory system conjugative DNA transfer family protein [Clostridiales bacterium]
MNRFYSSFFLRRIPYVHAYHIISNTGGGTSDIWDVSAQALLKALLLRVVKGKDFKADNNVTIGAAYELIQNEAGEEYLDRMFGVVQEKRRSNNFFDEVQNYENVYRLTDDERICIGPYMTFKQASPNMRGNIITGLAARLQVFQNDIIKRITSEDDIDLIAPAKEKCAYYCIMSDQHNTLNFLSALFFSNLFIQLVEYADEQGTKRCDVPVNFLLDEFPVRT